MKKRLIKIGVAVLGVVLFLVCIGFFRNMITLNQVERIELHTYDHQSKGQMELTEKEEWTLITLYNLSRQAGDVDAEPCCDSYGFYVYLDDGSYFYVGEGVGSKMILRSEDNCYLDNWLLEKYIYVLAEKYDLPID